MAEDYIKKILEEAKAKKKKELGTDSGPMVGEEDFVKKLLDEAKAKKAKKEELIKAGPEEPVEKELKAEEKKAEEKLKDLEEPKEKKKGLFGFMHKKDKEGLEEKSEAQKPVQAGKPPEAKAKEVMPEKTEAVPVEKPAEKREAQKEEVKEPATTAPAEPAIPASAEPAPPKTAEEEEKERGKSAIEEKLEKTKEKKLVDEYGEVKVYEIPGESLKYYKVPVPRPTKAERTIINTLKEITTRLVTIEPYQIRDPEQRRAVYYHKVIDILKNSPEMKIPEHRWPFYANTVVRDMVGYGLLDSLLKDDWLEEVMVIGPNKPVYIFHRKHEVMLTNVEFFTDKEIQDLVNRIGREVGKRIDISNPLLDSRLYDGSRVNATIPPASVDGSTLTIRKFKKDPLSIIDLIRENTFSSRVAAFLWLCVEGLSVKPANVLIAGGTGSGKTTLLNVMASFIPVSERVISIEDTAELSLPLKHWIRMEAKPPGLEGKGEITMDALTKNTLRMRPDRVIVGEVRHKEAFSLLTAMNTGHDGSMGTVHANSPEETIVRLTNPPMDVPEVMLAGLDLVIMEHRLHDKAKGTIRRVTDLAEVVGAIEENAKARVLYKRDPKTDDLKRAFEGESKYIIKLMELTGASIEDIDREIDKRDAFLKGLLKKGIRNIREVGEHTQRFIDENPFQIGG